MEHEKSKVEVEDYQIDGENMKNCNICERKRPRGGGRLQNKDGINVRGKEHVEVEDYKIKMKKCNKCEKKEQKR